ncbi:addiction module antitoxin, RelB/DinJ family [Desulfitobacterium hafniense DCB-2]|uniref:Addiction module antitoxin, RelB/DinJ n=3 Tax=Desulfitobacterium hafniense TaxID=49338 RepID=A0A098B2B3_DESHA|nr:type II toxin-antitoxin system RelB/DinJ family antitoxin [Desulfitobacterium hafniense]ACL21590.1 addiction module antitoxin, RelB/DinJ family [Desulfitobacterium hafniense DCB-2]EHL07728.1 addiction module antitoxin, RelB/DinJ family [Desulfitobacterium hafniense DP7]CDX02505.1 Addiction module antitoxin, RelB/DinJ [Desulfitobacterium hafniense]
MAQTNINIRMDENLKQDFDRLCGELGLTMTTAFTIFAKTMVRQNGIPFPVSLDMPNEETLAAINEIQRMKQKPNKKLYSNFSELLREVETDV